MSVFDKKYIHCLWDDMLAGKEVFFADDVVNLHDIVKYNVLDYKDVIKFSGYGKEPFKSAKFCNTNWKFAYYDPLYEVKLAYQEGCPVLSRRRDVRDAPWLPDINPTWQSRDYDYKLGPAGDTLHTRDNQDISLFDEKYIYRTWEPELEGKLCWFADNFYAMENAFYSSSPELIGPSGSFDYPFILCCVPEGSESRLWRYVYYDPYLELKKARKRGDIIEYNSEDGWCLVSADDEFVLTPEFYRVRPSAKPFDLVTHRELARWINLGKGELTLSDRSVIGPDNKVTHSFDYEVGQADVPVNDDIRVRSWDSDEWTSPTREYLGLC